MAKMSVRGTLYSVGCLKGAQESRCLQTLLMQLGQFMNPNQSDLVNEKGATSSV